jgi:site-specific DNA-methyltransferase (adenine-specific)
VKALHEQGIESGSHAAGNKGETNHVSGKGYGGAFKPMTNNPDYHADEGGVDRFFTQLEAEGGAPFRYIPKANRKEAGCGEFEIQHVTVKPLALMRWIIKLVTRKEGIVLDPYAGSGSTCHAAVLEGMHFIGIERDETNHAEAVRRLEIVMQKDQERKEAEAVYAFSMGREP